ncbi:MAG: hydrogenase expression/formation protein HypE, partial [Pseudonocardiales bacterium]|nr:hydrogenase expression/formation protein HypE [Pseudonocardiales bacterium]
AGVGVIPAGRELSAQKVRPGDKLVLSGTLGDHGMAVMMARGDMGIDADIHSDTAPVHELVDLVLAAAPSTRWMRDPTRGGLGTICNELAQDSGLAVILDEASLPVLPMVLGACDMLGIDPLYVANEGKFVAVVPADEAEAAVAALRSHPLGAAAVIVGEIVEQPEGVVALRTAFGGSRIVDMLVGDPLPRIC